jgi:hypothetical protein
MLLPNALKMEVTSFRGNPKAKAAGYYFCPLIGGFYWLNRPAMVCAGETG